MKKGVIVVGSGIGGMSAALTLAKEGCKVTVLEQHARPGGLMQSYQRGGCSFSTGVECVGALGEGQVSWRYFKYMGVLDRMRLAPMDRDGFAELAFPTMDFQVPCGQAAFHDRLLGRFPSERPAIETFFSDMRRTLPLFPLYNLEDKTDSLTADAQRPLRDYLDRMTDNAELKAVLTALNPLYGIEPAECPVYIHFLVLDSLLTSAWRVDEAGAPLAQCFTDALRAAGGEVRCSARVVGIESRDGTATGVTLAGGERLAADTVVFAGHPRRLLTLCAPDQPGLRPAFRQRLSELPETPGIFGLALAWKGTDCPLPRRDAFIYRGLSTAAQYGQRLLNGDPSTLSLRAKGTDPHMVCCSAAPTPRTAPNGEKTWSVVAMCLTSLDEWAPWAGSRTGERPPEYSAAKSLIASRMLETIRARWPGAAGRMAPIDTFTPLTLRDYTLSPTGSAYGVKRSVGAIASAKMNGATRIKGLYLAGQSIVLSGVLGTVISSITTCCEIVGRKYLIGRIRKETE